jgi:hypothetical protein
LKKLEVAGFEFDNTDELMAKLEELIEEAPEPDEDEDEDSDEDD